MERTTTCLPIALGDVEKQVTFREMDTDYLSGVEGVNIDEIKGYLKKGNVKVVNETIVQQRKLSDVLSENSITEVDFVSLDVEGYELPVLQGIDFDKVTIKCFIIENEDNDEMIFKIRKYLVDRGYFLLARLTRDDVFVHKNYFYYDDNK